MAYQQSTSTYRIPYMSIGERSSGMSNKRAAEIVDSQLAGASRLIGTNGIISEGTYSAVFTSASSSVSLTGTASNYSIEALIHGVYVAHPTTLSWTGLPNSSTVYLYVKTAEEYLYTSTEFSSLQSKQVQTTWNTTGLTPQNSIFVGTATTTTSAITLNYSISAADLDVYIGGKPTIKPYNEHRFANPIDHPLNSVTGGHLQDMSIRGRHLVPWDGITSGTSAYSMYSGTGVDYYHLKPKSIRSRSLDSSLSASGLEIQTSLKVLKDADARFQGKVGFGPSFVDPLVLPQAGIHNSGAVMWNVYRAYSGDGDSLADTDHIILVNGGAVLPGPGTFDLPDPNDWVGREVVLININSDPTESQDYSVTVTCTAGGSIVGETTVISKVNQSMRIIADVYGVWRILNSYSDQYILDLISGLDAVYLKQAAAVSPQNGFVPFVNYGIDVSGRTLSPASSITYSSHSGTVAVGNTTGVPAGETNTDFSVDGTFGICPVEFLEGTNLISDDTVASRRSSLILARTSTAANVIYLVPLDGTTNNNGRMHIVKDISGNAATHNITLSGVGCTIDGATTKVINTNYGSARIFWFDGAWLTY